MKKTALALFLFLLLAGIGRTQEIQRFTGTWEGRLTIGVELRIVFHITTNGSGALAASADSPDQSAYGLTCDTVIAAGEKIRIDMHGLRAVFSGSLTNDTTITGTFNQGIDFPLVLQKVDKPSERKRPQALRPPFPYKSEDVEYDNTGKTLHYGATITIPPGTGPFPAALLITGSGQQNRDENILGHKPFAVLADALTRNGYVVLRVDDRETGKSTGIFSQATTADFAEDVNTSLDYLLSRPEVDKAKTGLIGHSEGGMIAPMVAAKRSDVGFLVLLAGPGIPSSELLAEQTAAILLSTGVSQPAVDAYTALYQQLMDAATHTDTLSLATRANGIIRRWANATDTTLQRALGIATEKDALLMGTALVSQLSEKWFRYFLAFDPLPYLQQLRCKVLALNGSKDVQVIASSNLAGIAAALKKSRSKKYTVKELPGMNHLFQTCDKCTLAEYGQLEETFSPVALKVITSWLDENVK